MGNNYSETKGSYLDFNCGALPFFGEVKPWRCECWRFLWWEWCSLRLFSYFIYTKDGGFVETNGIFHDFFEK